MLWFPVDKNARNDWRIKAVKRQFGVAGVGQLFELWSFVASEGSQTDEGRGVQRDGRPLDLHGMADDCDFASVEDLMVFLNFLADKGHIDADTWHKQGIVYLPAMNRRLESYRLSKGYALSKRGPGRPRKTPENNSVRLVTEAGGISRNTSETPVITRAEVPKTPDKAPNPETPGNSRKPQDIPGNSRDSKVLSNSTDPINASTESRSEDQVVDDPAIPTPTTLMELWNRVRQPGPKILELTPTRRQKYRRALKAKPDLADWEAAILYLNRAPWANASGNGEHANWRADLDYLAKPGGVTKALERIAAAALPGARTGAAVGRVAPVPGAIGAALAKRYKDDP